MGVIVWGSALSFNSFNFVLFLLNLEEFQLNEGKPKIFVSLRRTFF